MARPVCSHLSPQDLATSNGEKSLVLAVMNLDISSILATARQGTPTKDDLMAVLTPCLSDWSNHPRYATATLSALGKKRRPDLVELVLECMEDARVEANVYHYSVACLILFSR